MLTFQDVEEQYDIDAVQLKFIRRFLTDKATRLPVLNSQTICLQLMSADGHMRYYFVVTYYNCF